MMESDFESGKNLYEQRKFKEAFEYFKLALKDGPASEELYLFSGKTARALDLHVEANKIFDQGLNLFPNSAHLFSELGVGYFHLNDKPRALKMLDQALKLDPENPYRYSSRAYIRANIGDLDGAIEDYEEAIKLDPQDEIAHNNLGLLYEKQGYQQKAKQSFNNSDNILEAKGQGPKARVADHEKQELGTKTENGEETKKLTMKSYGSTIRSFFTNKNERKEFGKFLRSWFSKK